MTTTYSVPGMSCGHCVEAITGEVGKVDGVTDVDIALKFYAFGHHSRANVEAGDDPFCEHRF